MRPWFSAFPWSESPRSFGLTLGAALLLCALVYITLLTQITPPIPLLVPLPSDALSATMIPPDTKPTTVLTDPLPEAVLPILSYFRNHPAMNEALKASNPSEIIVFPATASGSPQFTIIGNSVRTEGVLDALAQEYPEKQPYRLPDRTLAAELIVNRPEMEKSQVISDSGLLHTPSSTPPLWFGHVGDLFIFSTVPPTNLKFLEK